MLFWWLSAVLIFVFSKKMSNRSTAAAPNRLRRQLPASFPSIDSSPCSYRNQYRFRGHLEVVEVDHVNKVHLVWERHGLPEIGYIYAVRVRSDLGIGELMMVLENCSNAKLMGVSMAAGHWCGDRQPPVDMGNDWWLRLWVEHPWTPADIFKRILTNKK